MCDYRELLPPRHLATHVACFWTQSIGAPQGDARPRVLPDGCIDIVWINDAAAVAGPATFATLPALPPFAKVVGVRFRPGTAAKLLSLPASELLDLHVPLGDLWDKEVARSAARVSEAPTVEARLAAVERFVASRLSKAAPFDHCVVEAASWLARRPSARTGDLAELAGLSERQLLRRFEAAVGYGPKTLHRILRFQLWLRLARRTPEGRRDLVDLAAATGYADQSHMTREVTQLAGLSPTKLLGRDV